MAGEKVDRRVKYTKSLLKTALVELMQTRHISGISVSELCKLADVHRSTFYVHYADQLDLLTKIEQEALENLKKSLSEQDFNAANPFSVQILVKILDYVKDNSELFKALLSENCDFAFQKDIVDLAQIISSQMAAVHDVRTMEYIKEFSVTGCLSVLLKWLQNGTAESTTQIATLVLQMIYSGMNGVTPPE